MKSVAVDSQKGSVIGAAGRFARSFYQLLANRRKFERQPMAGVVKIVSRGYVSEVTHVCSCADISPRGMSVDSPEPFEPGMIIELHADEQGSHRMARVCHCCQRDSVYHVGLEFVAAPSN